MFPHAHLTPFLSPHGSKELAAQLHHVINQKRQHHEECEDHGEVVLAVSKSMFDVIAVIVQCVEGLGLDLPSGTATTHELQDILAGDGDIRHPGTMLCGAIRLDVPICQKIHHDVLVRRIQRHLVEIPKPVGHSLFLYAHAHGDASLCRRLDLLKQPVVIARLDAQNDVQVVAESFADVGGIRTETVLRHDDAQMWMHSSELL